MTLPDPALLTLHLAPPLLSTLPAPAISTSALSVACSNTPPDPAMLAKALKPEDIAATCLFLLRLPARAHVAELVLVPSR